MPELIIGASIQTARINELPLYSVYGPLTSGDYVPLYLEAFGKTVKIDIQSLYNYMHDAGGGTFTPVILGDKYIYTVPEAEAGGVTASIPSLAGQNFFLQNENGYPYTVDEFDILNAGGFKLKKPGEVLIEGARYVLTLYSLQGGSSSNTNTVQTLITGSVQVSTNTTYDVVNHVNKLIQLRGNATQLQFTLPLVDDIPDNTIIVIEAMINNNVEHKILTQGGQSIYINNQSKPAIYMRAGEVLWLYRGDDGFYVINQDFAKMYLEIASNPIPGYKTSINELQCSGQLILKNSYRRVVEAVQTFGGSLVSKSTYDSDPTTYKAYWVDWDTDNLRMPDLGDLFIRGIDTGTAGRFQDETVNISTNVKGVKQTGQDTIGPAGSPLDNIQTGGEFDLNSVFDISPKQGTETRPVNAGFPFKIKI